MSIYGWQRYLGIEKDFLEAQFYVSFDISSAYSEFFTREVILLGVEIEAAFKELCSRTTGTVPGNMGQYKDVILSNYPGIVDIYVKNKQTNIIEKPFENWDNGRLTWWDAYTNVKHNLIDQNATLQVALSMLKAYELLLFCVAAKQGDFSIDYLSTPKLFIPDFDPGLSIMADMRTQLNYSGNQILSRLRRN